MRVQLVVNLVSDYLLVFGTRITHVDYSFISEILRLLVGEFLKFHFLAKLMYYYNSVKILEIVCLFWVFSFYRILGMDY